MWNAGARRILGYSVDDVVGKLCFDIAAGRDEKGNLVCQAGCSDMALAKARSLVPTRDMLARAKDGSEVWVNVTNIPVPSESGGLPSMVHIFREITSQKHSEQLVQQLTSIMKSFASSQTERAKFGQEAMADHDSLTPRERQVLHLLCEGSNAGAIAQNLVISSATVRKHIQNILKKLGVHTTLEAVAYCSRHNLFISSPD